MNKLVAMSQRTNRIPLHQVLVVGHGGQPNDGDDGVQDEWEEEVFVKGDSLAAQTSARKTKQLYGKKSKQKEAKPAHYIYSIHSRNSWLVIIRLK